MLANGWTAGQYSAFRATLGIYLFVHFLQLAPWGVEVFSNRGVLPDRSASPFVFLFPNLLAVWDAPGLVTAMLVGAAGLSLLFAIGLYDRAAAVAVWYVLACTFGRNPLIANPALPFVGWILLAHALMPRARYGSWFDRGAADAVGGWRMPQPLHLAAWIVMSLGYSYSGYTKLVSPSWIDGTAMARVLANPLARPGVVRDLLLQMPDALLHLATWGGLAFELAFAPLALFQRLRPFLWTGMVAMHLTLMLVIDFADLSLGMLVLHFFTFDPAWIAPRHAAQDRVFYDGHCGLCHGLVRFALSEDRTGATFRFAPLDSSTFRSQIAEGDRAGLPDSIVVDTAEGRLLTKSAAVLYILDRLGGLWRVLSWVLHAVPSRVRDAVYDAIARIRSVVFKRPADVCPLVPPDLIARFDP